MPIQEKDIDAHGNSIIIEFDDNFEKDYPIPDKHTRHAFLASLFTELKKLYPRPDGCQHFILANMKCEKDSCHVFLSKKNALETLYRVIIKHPHPKLEQKSETPPPTRSNQRIIRELELDEKEFQSWKIESDNVIAKINHIFDICQTQIKQNFFVVNAHEKAEQKKRAQDDEDKQLNRAVDTFNEKLGEVHIDIQLLEQIHALKNEMEERLEQRYTEHMTKTGRLTHLKENLLLILRETAMSYYNKISSLEETVYPGYETYFNVIFADIAHIENKQLTSKPLNSQKMMLKDIIALFNALFTHLDTFYSRWLDTGVNPFPRPEPLTTLHQHLEHFLKKYKPTEAPIHYQSFEMTQPHHSLKREMEIIAECEIMKKSTRQELHTTLAKQQAILQKVTASYPKKLIALTQHTLAIANYVELKNNRARKPAYASLDAITPEKIAKASVRDIIEEALESRENSRDFTPLKAL